MCPGCHIRRTSHNQGAACGVLILAEIESTDVIDYQLFDELPDG